MTAQAIVANTQAAIVKFLTGLQEELSAEHDTPDLVRALEAVHDRTEITDSLLEVNAWKAVADVIDSEIEARNG